MTIETRIHGWRRWMLGGYALVATVLVTVWLYSIVVPIAGFVEKRTQEGMVSVANATAVALQTSDLPASEVLERIAASDGLRLTLIASNGTVLAESIEDGLDMQNHAGRPEVVSALAGETGYDRRVSTTDGVEYQYVAIPCTYHDDLVVVRVSRAMKQINALRTRYLSMSIGFLTCAIAATLVTGWLAFRRANDPIRELESVRTDFVANASHELKTPVTGIQLLSDSINEAANDDDLQSVKGLSERLSSETARMQSLVNDLMVLSRLEDGSHGVTEDVTCDISAVVAESVKSHRELSNEKGLMLTLCDETATGTYVAISATDASLVCDNLVNNALIYTEHGSVTVYLSVEGGEAVLEVSDTGIGIPYAEQERIFERFYRVDTARSRESGGTGLGLSLVRHAVEGAHGTIELHSEPGKGSSFKVRLPLATGSQPLYCQPSSV